MSVSLKGKTGLITGASSGIGRATAVRLAAEGMRLALVARSKDKLDALALGLSPDAWEKMIALNVSGVFRAIRAVLPHMMQRRSGDIIVTSSIAGHQAMPLEPVYSATKHAVQSFVHSVRRQVAADGIRVGSIAPGTVLNQLWGYTDSDRIAAKVAERAGLTCEDVAEAVVFMLTRPPNVTIRDLVMLPQNQDI